MQVLSEIQHLYDARKQLLSVNNATTGEIVESYVYDETGNILSKTVRDETTTYTYDKSNQLLTKTTPDGETINYTYDAAGRMTSEGDKTYTYGWADKVLEVGNDKGVLSEFEYYNSGQISNATHYANIEGDLQKGTQNALTTETFVWDGLALIDRNGISYINEPHAGGGNPVLAIGENGVQTILTDILGTSVGTFDSANGYAGIEKSTFGEHNSDTTSFYTGKPHVENLGYVFLMRNYRSDLSKWQTSDPIGYPNGWNNFAYCNNQSTLGVDLYGALTIAIGGFMEGTTECMTSALNSYLGVDVDNDYTVRVYSWDEKDEIISAIKEALSENPNEEINIIGHSYGGDTAYLVARDCGVDIANLITLDPVSRFTFFITKPSKVGKWINVVASEEGWSFGDIVAGVGGAWGNVSTADLNISVTNADHEDVYSMLVALNKNISNLSSILSQIEIIKKE